MKKFMTLAKENALLAHYSQSGLCVDYPLLGGVRKWDNGANLYQNQRENDDYICRGHILNTLSNFLFNVYQHSKTEKQLWATLQSKYLTEDATSKKFLVSNFMRYYDWYKAHYGTIPWDPACSESIPTKEYEHEWIYYSFIYNRETVIFLEGF